MLMPRVSSHVREQWLSIKSLCAHFVFVELANAAERSQAKEDVLRDQDTPAQFGPPKESLRQQIHRMFLLRVKLMHFVNSLHNYIMTRVGICLSIFSVLLSCVGGGSETTLIMCL